MSKKKSRPVVHVDTSTTPEQSKVQSVEVTQEEPKTSGYENYPQDHIIQKASPYDGPAKANPNTDVVRVRVSSDVNFRQQPNMNATIIEVARRGTIFIVLDRFNNWLRVQTDNVPSVTGFVRSEFTEEI